MLSLNPDELWARRTLWW